MPRRLRTAVSLLAKMAAICLVIIVAYVASGFTLGAIPAQTPIDPPPGPHDPTVIAYVESNGVHTGLLLPVNAAGVDWSGLVKPAHLADPRYAGTHIWIGWGERDFYLVTPHWSDVRPLTLLHAAFGSNRTLMHVDHEVDPRPGPDVRPLRLSATQYRRLAATIRASFALRPDGSAIPLKGYGPADVFYEAQGRYDAIHTCNEWVGAVLRSAGVRIGRWTPFSQTVMWWF